MKYVPHLLAASIIVAALVLLWPRSSHDVPPHSAPPATNTNSSGDPLPLPPRRMHGETAAPAPTEPGVPGTIPDEADPARHYIRDDGAEVRDHRANPGEPNTERTSHPPGGMIRLKASTLATVRTTLRPSVQACMDQFRNQADPGAKAQAVLTLSVKAGQLNVDEVAVQSDGIRDEDGFRACMIDKMLGYQMGVEETEDIARYTLTFPYDF